MDPLRRRQRRVYDSDDDDDFFAAAAPVQEAVVEEAKPVEIPKPKPGTTVGDMLEELKKKLQAAVIEGMFKYAEQKYGRTKKKQEQDQQVSTKEDFALYLNSLKVKAKQADTRLQGQLRELKKVQAKVDLAQKDFDLRNGQLVDAEAEKKKAEAEGRDPTLPSSFIVPSRSKKAGATLGSLVMKASKKDWGAALEDFASRRKGAGGAPQPAWAVKRNKASSIPGAGKKGDAPAAEAPAAEAAPAPVAEEAPAAPAPAAEEAPAKVEEAAEAPAPVEAAAS